MDFEHIQRYSKERKSKIYDSLTSELPFQISDAIKKLIFVELLSLEAAFY